VYLPVTDLFDYLKIRNILSKGLDSISGFYITQNARYLINKSLHRITYQEKEIEMKPEDFIITENTPFMNLSLFGKVFGLKGAFSFRDLSVTLNKAGRDAQ
jgi:hypothetical protein